MRNTPSFVNRFWGERQSSKGENFTLNIKAFVQELTFPPFGSDSSIEK